MNELFLCDCLDYMRGLPDKQFDLAIVDPPYGITNAFHKKSRLSRYGQTKTVNDLKPLSEYFNILFRISKDQIIWGYNHLSDLLPSTKEFIFWHKHQPLSTFSDGELAWTSFRKTAKCFDFPFFGAIGAENRIHPTQKPVALYKWILQNYAKPGMKIFDSHSGSGSLRIACYDLGYDLVSCEIDKDYFKSNNERFNDHIKQGSLFEFKGGQIV